MDDSKKKGKQILKPKKEKKNKSGTKISSVKKEGFLNISGNEGLLLDKFWGALSLCGPSELRRYLYNRDPTIIDSLNDAFDDFAAACASDDLVANGLINYLRHLKMQAQKGQINGKKK